MSPRPRKVSDDDILSAAYRVMNRVGPSELTLAAIAAETGVTPAALVQRFGSKRALLVALAQGAAGGMASFLSALREKYPSPLAALRAYAECTAGLAASPAAFIRNLAYLQNDLTDPGLRAPLLAQTRETRARLRGLLRDAVTAGELRRDTDVATLARVIETVLAGSLMTWAIYQDGPADRWLRADVNRALAPYLAESVSRRWRVSGGLKPAAPAVTDAGLPSTTRGRSRSSRR